MAYIAYMVKTVRQDQPDDPTTAAKRKGVKEGIASLDQGRFVRHEDMRRWLLSWGTDQDTPPPSEWTFAFG